MTSKQLDYAWLNKKLSELFPDEDFYHMLLHNREYHALQRVLKEWLSNEREGIKQLLEKGGRGRKKVDHSLTERYERCAKTDRLLGDIALVLANQQQPH